MHQSVSANHVSTECLRDGLMPEAHPENGKLARERSDGPKRDAGLVRRARTGRNEEPVGLACGDVARLDGVVLHDLARRAELAEVLDEIERERVVVVDDEHSAHGPRSISSASAAARLSMSACFVT